MHFAWVCISRNALKALANSRKTWLLFDPLLYIVYSKTSENVYSYFLKKHFRINIVVCYSDRIIKHCYFMKIKVNIVIWKVNFKSADEGPLLTIRFIYSRKILFRGRAHWKLYGQRQKLIKFRASFNKSPFYSSPKPGKQFDPPAIHRAGTFSFSRKIQCIRSRVLITN